MGLADQDCNACRGEVLPLAAEQVKELKPQLDPGWRVVEGHHLERQFQFPDFARALAFANQVGAIAEEQGHHPDLHLGWGRVGIEIWTHKINGLTESDFVLAAKIDRLI
jgi:4a-hydroxytetrahydrobiopterin dehydratase